VLWERAVSLRLYDSIRVFLERIRKSKVCVMQYMKLLGNVLPTTLKPDLTDLISYIKL
jgi:hypothetical protein